MAKKNKIEIEVKVDDKGTTKKVGLDAKKASAGLDDVGKSARTADRNLKGAAQASSNTTKNFSKMAQGTGGLVAAYATLAANIFAISAAFQFLKRAGDLRALQAAQQQYTSKTGLSMKLLTSRIQEATGGIVSFQEASQAAAIGIAAGLSPDQLERLGSAAKNAAAALGRDTTDAFQRLTRGAIKAEPELLDELGIIVRLEKATKDYANAMKIADRDLTTFEKTQAVVNATLTQAEEKFDDIGDNVNEIARLGKAFDDLVKDIQRAIVGPAEFIANVFTKNVNALSAAFAILGVNITKSLSSGLPQFENLSAAASGARARISGAALSGSVTGAALAGGDFEQKHLNRLKVAAASKTSTIINLSKMEQTAIRRDIKLIEADHARSMAKMKGGFKGYVLNAIASLKLLQAEHGRVMGTMKAAIGGFASFASKALNAIAIIGVLTLAISMAKELINLMKSKELKAIEDRAETMSRRFKEQNEAVIETLQTLDKAESTMGRIVQFANIFSQLSSRGSTRLLEGVQQLDAAVLFKKKGGLMGKSGGVTASYSKEAKESRKIAQARVQAMTGAEGTLTAFLTTMRLASVTAKQAGKDTKSFDTSLKFLQGTMKTLSGVNLKTTQGVKQYNNIMLILEKLIPDVTRQHTALSTSLQAESNAVNSVSKSYETYLQLQSEARGKVSLAGRAASNIKSFGTALAGMTSIGSEETLGGLRPEDAKKFASVLGMAVEDFQKLTKQDALSKFTAGGQDLITRQKSIDQGAALNREALLRAQKTGFKFVKEEANVKKQLADLDLQLLKFEQEKAIAKATGTELTDERINQINAETQAIQAQSDLIKHNFSDIGTLGNTMGQSLEQGLGNALNGLITGTMNVKQAFASMAQTVLQSIAKVLAEMMAVKLIKSAFGGTDFGSFLGLPEAATGGIISNGKKVQGYSAGGIAKGSRAGYPAILHGTEAVVPLPNGKSIPVEMKNGGTTQNNVVVNVSADGTSRIEQNSGMDSEKLGKAIAAAVQVELQNQKRSGGILNPYGAA